MEPVEGITSSPLLQKKYLLHEEGGGGPDPGTYLTPPPLDWATAQLFGHLGASLVSIIFLRPYVCVRRITFSKMWLNT